MSIQLRVRGVDYSQFDSISVSRSLDSIAGNFELTAVASNTNGVSAKSYPFSIGDSCQILVDGQIQLTGYLEAVNISHSSSEHSVSFYGRDKTADVIDSNVGEWATFSGGSLQGLVLITLHNAGINVGLHAKQTLWDELEANPFTADEGSAAGLGETVFSYLESYARKRQVLMTTDGFGNIEFVRTDDNNRKTYGLYNTIKNISGANNILSANVRFDASKRFRFYRVTSGANSTQSLGVREEGDSDRAFEGTTAEVVDEDIRPDRVRHIQAERASTEQDCIDRAVWEKNLAYGRFLNYDVTVRGHSDLTGQPWQLNALYPINDEFCDLRGMFLLSGISWRYSLASGSTTNLTFVAPEAYSNISRKPPKTDKRGAGGGAKIP